MNAHNWLTRTEQEHRLSMLLNQIATAHSICILWLFNVT